MMAPSAMAAAMNAGARMTKENAKCRFFGSALLGMVFPLTQV